MSIVENSEVASYIPSDVSEFLKGVPEETKNKIIEAFMAKKDLEYITLSEKNPELQKEKRLLCNDMVKMLNWKNIDNFLESFRAANEASIKAWSIDLRLTDRFTYFISVKSWAFEVWIFLYFNKEWFITESAVNHPSVKTNGISDSKNYEMVKMLYETIKTSV